MLSLPIQNIYNHGKTIYLFNRYGDKLSIMKEQTFYPYFYEEDPNGVYITIDGKKVNKIKCRVPGEVKRKRSNNSYEADILYTKRYLIDNIREIVYSNPKYFFIDIEVKAKELPNYLAPIHTITCISLYNSLYKSVQTWYVDDFEGTEEEKEDKLLTRFVNYIKEEQPDILTGWNFIKFDYAYLYARIKKLWNLEFSNLISPINESRFSNNEFMYPAGISILDYLDLFKKIYNKEVSYALDEIAQKYLKTPPNKKIDFNQISEEIKNKNIEDIKKMIAIENLKNIFPYYDEIRRMGKCLWEDLTWHCLDKNTEILTNNGWKNYKTIDEFDKIYSMNPKTQKLELINIKNIFIYNYKGKMIYYDNDGRINFCVTPNHKFLMYYNRPERNKTKIELNEIDSIPDRDDRYFFIGSEGYEGNYNQLTDNQIKLIGWIIAEGHFEKLSKAISIYQNQGKKSNEIQELLDQENIIYSKYIYKNNKTINFRIRAKDTVLYRTLLNNKKELPKLVYNLSIKQKRLLIETLMKGDGHWQSNNSGYYCSKNKNLIEQFQLLCILAGWNVVIVAKEEKFGIMYYGNIIKNKFKLFRYNSKKEIQYNDKIWCIENQYHNFLIKRNNQIVLSGNSKVLDIMLLTEAKQKGIVLPSKNYEERESEESEFEGAYRRCDIEDKEGNLIKHLRGFYKDLWKLDLSGAYPNAIINFCLDISNLTENKNEHKINITDRITNETLYTIYMKQNVNALLPTIARKLLFKKDILKKNLNSLDPETKEAKDLQIKYDAIKALVNSLFGVCGLRVFRLFNNDIASAITSIVRDLLHYVEDKLAEQGIEVIYIDTDSVFIKSKNNPTEMINELVKQWAKEKHNKDNVTIEFDCEGIFEKILIVALCHYKGYLKKKNGKIKEEIKGIEVKRKDSSKFMKKFQGELIEKVLNEESKEQLEQFIENSKKEIKKVPLINIGFPCKINATKDYKSPPIFMRALKYTNEIISFKKVPGDIFYYIYVKPFGQAKRISKRNLKNKETGKKELRTSETIIDKNVLAFDEENYQHIKEVDWNKMIKRNITDKSKHIFEAMGWTKKEITQEEALKELQRRGLI